MVNVASEMFLRDLHISLVMLQKLA